MMILVLLGSLYVPFSSQTTVASSKNNTWPPIHEETLFLPRVNVVHIDEMIRILNTIF